MEFDPRTKVIILGLALRLDPPADSIWYGAGFIWKACSKKVMGGLKEIRGHHVLRSCLYWIWNDTNVLLFLRFNEANIKESINRTKQCTIKQFALFKNNCAQTKKLLLLGQVR